MIRAVIFDCFGVLATDGLLPFRDRYFGDDPARMEKARVFGRHVDAGLDDYEDYLERLGKMAGISKEDARRQIENNVPDEKLFTYIKDQLKPKYKIGMLSNAGDNWLDEIFTPEQIALFDAVALSYQTGFLKPAARAYEIIAQKLGVEPAECVLIDDQERYCAAARDAGMQAIWYKDYEQCKRELNALLSQS